MKINLLVEPNLAGRKNELEELAESLNCAIKGKGTTIFISGEAGSGKTRLLTEFLKTAKKRQVTILTGWCLSDAAIPYFPFQEAFDSYLSSNQDAIGKLTNDETGLKSWLKAKNQLEQTGQVTPQAWRDQAFSIVTKVLLFLSTKEPVILALEDIHWADSASLLLIHYLARQVRTERILVVATFRSEESENPSNALSKLLLLMGRDDLYEDLKLPKLELDEVCEIAENMLGGKVRRDFTDKLASESLGNPLFIVESLRTLYQQGCLSKSNGEWRLSCSDFEVPKKVKDLILNRLRTLNRNQRIILDVASVAGEKFDANLISVVTSKDKTEVLRELDEIAKATLLIQCDGNSLKFGHAKFREFIYSEVPVLLRKEYHQRLGEGIEATLTGTDELLTVDLAYHFLRGENLAKAIKYSLQAGEFALSHYSNAEAITNFNYVIEAADNNQEFAEEKMAAMEGLGDALSNTSMFKEAIKTLELLSNMRTDESKLRVLRKAMFAAFQCGDLQHLKELQENAETCTSNDRLENARALLNRGRIFSIQSMGPDALEAFRNALQVFEEEYDLPDVALSLIGAGARDPGLGKQQEGIAECLRAISLFEELGDFKSQLGAYCNAGFIFNMCLLEDQALEMFGKAIETNQKLKMNDPIYLILAKAFSCKSLMQMGRFDDSLPYGLEALELSKKTDSDMAHGLVYSLLTRLYVKLNLPDTAKTYYDKVMSLPKEILVHPYIRAKLTKAVFLSAYGNRWSETSQLFNEVFEMFKTYPGAYGNLVEARLLYSWALERYGLLELSKTQSREIQKIRWLIKQKFGTVNLQANLMLKRRLAVGEDFEVRLDLVNVAAAKGKLVCVEGLIPKGCKVVSASSFCQLKNGFIDLNAEINAFQVITVKLRLIYEKAGTYTFEPCVLYIDELGESKKQNAAPITVTPQPVSLNGKIISTVQSVENDILFESEAAQKVFNFLIKAFQEDYVTCKIPSERSGWRTLVEVARNAHVTMHSMYGRSGHSGKAVLELDQNNLVESRFFNGERGRGGHIRKIRVAHEKENVKRLLGFQ